MTATFCFSNTSVYHALLTPQRLNALSNCDRNLLSYNATSFFLIFERRGRNFGMLVPPFVALLFWDIAWGLYLITFEDPLGTTTTIQSMNSLISPLLTPVSFLMVFRLGRAAVRYWDARAAVGKMVQLCRAMSSTALVGCCPLATAATTTTNTDQSDYHHQERLKKHLMLAEDFVRWVAVFPMAVKNFLRPWEGLECNRSQEVGSVLLATDKEEFLMLSKGGDTYAPILVLNRLRQLAYDASILYYRNPTIGAALFRQLNEQVDVLCGAWGAMERINGTPLPFAYVVHLRTFLLLYLFLWHVEAIASSGWIALLPIILTSWGLLGIEAAAVECERPFQLNSNHLALGKSCIVVSKNLAQTMENIHWLQTETLSMDKVKEIPQDGMDKVKEIPQDGVKIVGSLQV